ncbi:MAG: nitrous oxide reductase accessory protein NosL [Candidatus Marinimicrobia bacterium]|nr:nitrous oxide reductase accessory protein NosL [Candidatus Neomarinimicrobiota bacterium]
MKYIRPISIIIALLLLIILIFIAMGKTQQMIVVYEGNTRQEPVIMTPGKFQGSECGMIIHDLSYASQVIAPDGKTWFFDDHGCMAAWLNHKPFEKDAVIWVPDLDSGKWIDGRKAWYSRTDDTPMSYGFGAYSEQKDGFVDFYEMQQLMLKGETLANPSVRKQLLEK